MVRKETMDHQPRGLEYESPQPGIRGGWKIWLVFAVFTVGFIMFIVLGTFTVRHTPVGAPATVTPRGAPIKTPAPTGTSPASNQA